MAAEGHPEQLPRCSVQGELTVWNTVIWGVTHARQAPSALYFTLCSEAVGEGGYCSHFTDEAKASEATCPTHVGKEQSLDGA